MCFYNYLNISSQQWNPGSVSDLSVHMKLHFINTAFQKGKEIFDSFVANWQWILNRKEEKNYFDLFQSIVLDIILTVYSFETCKYLLSMQIYRYIFNDVTKNSWKIKIQILRCSW